MRRLLVLLAALLALAGTGAVVAPAALAAQPRASFNDIEDEVMCDTCNVPLNIADSPRADQERREIRALIAQGLTKQQIKDELRARYGPQILALPPDTGFNLAAYLVPVAVAIALVAVLVVLLPRWRRRTRDPGAAAGGASAAAVAVPDLSPADAARLDDDLARWEGR
jgi:cytochrome c-type biogenesis protein CcmH